jgi:DNA polymerase-3 subunit gamma/tau
MSQAFYREFRPHLWEQVVGQDHIVHTLQNAIRSNRVGHAYLFAGPRGTGKTTTARLLAKAVNCLDNDLSKRPCDVCDFCRAVNENRFLDLIEIDAASNTSVDDVRDLRDKVNFSPSQGRFKVYIIDEVHMLSTAAFNALLKTLEEPPPHAIFILATTEVHKIPATVLSRCQRHEFRRIPVKGIVFYLKKIVDEKHLQIEPEALTLVARQATGSMRDAVSLLDQLTSTGDRVTLSIAQTVLGTATSQAVISLVDAILARQAADGLNSIHQALDGGSDPRQFARQVVEYLRGLLLMRLGNADQVDAAPEIRVQMTSQAQLFELPRLLEAVRLFNSAAAEGRTGWQPSLLLELALAELLSEKSQPLPALPAQPDSRPGPGNAEPARSQPAATPSQTSTSVPLARQPDPAPKDDPGQTQPQTKPPVSTQPPPAAEKTASQKPEAEKPPGGASTGLTNQTEATSVLQRVQQNWPRIRLVVRKQRPATEALLNSCKVLELKDGILTLGFQGEIVRSKMDTAENLEMTSLAIASVVDVTVSIKCVVNSKAGTAPSDLDVDRDSMLGTALNLGGQIVHKE